MKEHDILLALHEAYKKAGTQAALAEKAGISQGRIADYLNERYSVGNMTVSTLCKLFPLMKIDFFGETTNTETIDILKEQLLEIFYSLDERGKIRMVTMSAANFGEKLKMNIKKGEK